LRIPIAREGVPFFAPPLVVGALVWPTLGPIVALPAIALGLALLWFFRDPERQPPSEEGVLVAPADGKVVRLLAGPEGSTSMSIFLSPIDVHVNRSPVDGLLREVEYRPGKYHAAYRGEASHENEQMRLQIVADGLEIGMRQITGVLVRRIVLWKRPGERLHRGERIGIMKFGSRVDLELPAGIETTVAQGARVRAGETIIARFVTT